MNTYSLSFYAEECLSLFILFEKRKIGSSPMSKRGELSTCSNFSWRGNRETLAGPL